MFVPNTLTYRAVLQICYTIQNFNTTIKKTKSSFFYTTRLTNPFPENTTYM